jgi:hypothetical protein
LIDVHLNFAKFFLSGQIISQKEHFEEPKNNVEDDDAKLLYQLKEKITTE